MLLSLGEDLLQNIESFATAVGGILKAISSANITNKREITITRDNISKKYILVLNNKLQFTQLFQSLMLSYHQRT